MAISAKELADILGVSRSTISMVYNDKKGISEETKMTVLQAAQKYGYVHTRRNHLYVIPAVIQYIIFIRHGEIVTNSIFFSVVLQGIEAQSKKLGYSLQISYFYLGKNHDKQLQSVIDAKPAGIIILATEMCTQDLDIFKNLQIPIVILDSYIDSSSSDCVTINNVQGAQRAANYLLEHGHTFIGCLSTDFAIRNFEERAAGFLYAMQQAVFKNPDIRYTIEKVNIIEEEISNYLDRAEELPSAFFVDNDMLATTFMKIVKQKGYRIPEDISVIGFDDIPFCEITEPTLTSMRVPKKALGEKSVTVLDQQLHDKSCDHVKLELSTTLVERCSVLNCNTLQAKA